MELISGLIIGLAGSFHCVGMCGPIVLALPKSKSGSWSFVSGRLLYNAGRIITYGFLGAIFGLLGGRLFLFGFQQSLSIALGILILASVFFTVKNKSILPGIPFINSLLIKLKITFSRVYRRNSKSAMLVTGILNGFLPCGFVYLGLSGAMLSGDAAGGIYYMMLFGLGTVPLMLGLALFGNFISYSLKDKIRKLIPAFTIVLALLFIARGLNLGIPYISPKAADSAKNDEVICH
jgi:sulfite exporter TauE/SafE